MQHEQEMKEMNNEFSCLTEENKEKILDMTKYLVFTQNTIVPAILQRKEAEGGFFSYEANAGK